MNEMYRCRNWKWIFILSCLGLVLTPRVEAQVSRLPAVSVGGTDYIRVSDVARYYGMNVSVSGKSISLVHPKYGSRVQFEIDSREARLNNVKAWFSSPPVVARGMTLVGRLDTMKVIDPIIAPPHSTGSTAFRAIMIDPGHGGNDNGTQSSNGLLEKSMTLDVAKRLQQFLAKQGFVVTSTRTRDVTTPLDERVSDTKQVRADLFVSIHFNSEVRGRSARGIETYCLTPSGAASTASSRALSPYLVGNRNDDRNMLLAYQVQRGVTSATGSPDRGVRRARFYVLQYAECPAILVECGFLSNTGEASAITSSAYREKIANGIGQGILNYKRTLER